MERLGLVGLPNSGKSTLFAALTGLDVTVAPHPFSTTETTVGIAPVPDERVDRLAELSGSAQRVYTGFEVTDIAALVKGSSAGEGLGNAFLGSLRQVDALGYVLRAFADDNVPGGSDPSDDLATLELELVVADLTSVQQRLEKQRKAAKGDPSLHPELEALERAEGVLDEGTPIYASVLTPDERARLEPTFLLTNKPALIVVNVGENDWASAAEMAASFGDAALPVCAQLEMEAARLDPAERTELLEGLGLGEGVVPRLARTAYYLLGRRTFLTTGEKESRAWTFRAGARAPQCAGVIHSDMQRGFIRAEVIRYPDLVEIGSWSRAKELGRVRLEGKDYEVQDGDVMEIRFNV